MLSKRLKSVRKNKGLTQEDLAKRVKTTKGTISNYENGHSTPSNEMLKDLADAIDRLQKYIDSSDGQLMKIEPMTNSWDNVYAFVSDSFKTMPLSEKESWVNETASDIKNRIIGGGIAEDPRIYFVYEDQSKLAVPDTFNESYKIKD